MLALKFKASIFSRIAAGETPCYEVAKTDEYLVCLDINPLSRICSTKYNAYFSSSK